MVGTRRLELLTSTVSSVRSSLVSLPSNSPSCSGNQSDVSADKPTENRKARSRIAGQKGVVSAQTDGPDNLRLARLGSNQARPKELPSNGFPNGPLAQM